MFGKIDNMFGRSSATFRNALAFIVISPCWKISAFSAAPMEFRVRNWSERIERLLRLSDLEEKVDAAAGNLSGGMRQLLAIGCALVHDPPLLFFDEPTAGLDPVHRQQIWNLLYDLSNEGKTIFVTTHYMDEAERCTEVGFIESGRLLAKASPRALKSSFRARLLEIDVEPLMPALVRLRDRARAAGRFLAQRQPAPLRARNRRN